MNLHSASYRDILAELTRFGFSLEDVAQSMGHAVNRQQIRYALIMPPSRKATNIDTLRLDILKVIAELTKQEPATASVDAP
jgi:hypothetical protein